MWTTSVFRHTQMPHCTAMMAWNGKTLSLIHLCYSHANEYQINDKSPALNAGRKKKRVIRTVNYLAVLSHLIVIMINTEVILLWCHECSLLSSRV